MSKVLAMLLGGLLGLVPAVTAVTAVAGEGPGASSNYKGLKVSPPPAAGTWAILDRDGASRQVPKYLSSLGQGETGTGAIVSPPFRVEADAIRFTLCGHDGQGGGANKNFIALIDAKTGKTLQQTTAPGNDAVQERSWDVAALRGREVRIEVHDGDPGGAFAWLGIGRIDAGPALRVEFNDRIPEGWTVRARPAEIRTEVRTEVLAGGVPFLRYPSQYTLTPASGALEIPCGFEAERVFFLGCTVPGGKPGETYGWIEIVYQDGPPDRFPLLLGFTLENYGKQLGGSKAMHLHRSADPFQHYLVLAPRRAVVEKIVLRRQPNADLVPRITAVTCQTAASGERLVALPQGPADAGEEAWIRAHAIRSNLPDRDEIGKEIRRAHKVPPP